MPPYALALSVRQPWAWALCAGQKDIENRTWLTDYRGTIWIHAASKPLDPIALQWVAAHCHARLPPDWTTGALIGSVHLTDIAPTSPSPWYIPGHYAWIVTRPRLLRTPIPVRGGRRLFPIATAILRGG